MIKVNKQRILTETLELINRNLHDNRVIAAHAQLTEDVTLAELNIVSAELLYKVRNRIKSLLQDVQPPCWNGFQSVEEYHEAMDEHLERTASTETD